MKTPPFLFATTFALAVLACDIPSANAAPSKAEVKRYLQMNNVGCEINIPNKPMLSGRIRGTDKEVTVVKYTIEGCGGGNSWNSTFAVIYKEGNVIKEYQNTVPSQVVDSISFSNGEIIVKSLDYKPDDARCCPTDATTYRVIVTGGRLVSTR